MLMAAVSPEMMSFFCLRVIREKVGGVAGANSIRGSFDWN